ncbi:MAG TPA: glycosyltransferase family 1 protein [Phycisphaerales bacterium]|nr:glycosyltransferase family 1 protein [Phycisphaerales bacterium]
MRILHISTRLILGGSQENTVLSCEGQARLGHRVHLAFGPIFGPEGSLLDRVRRFRSPDGREIVTHEIPHLRRELSPLDDWRAYRELRTLLRAVRPDIVHTHSSKAGVLARAAAWAEGGGGGRQGRLAVVHTIHGPPFHRFESRWRNALYIAAERFAARRCHAIVSVADAMTDQFRAARIGRPDQFVTVHSGMETEPYLYPDPGESREATRAALGLEPHLVVIATVARLAELKGHDDLIDALQDDLHAHPDWRLLWIGDGWSRERLVERLLRANLRHRVVLTGLVPPERIPTLLRASDLLVHPSYREGLPRTVPQALLAGTPVVAYDTDGTREACLHEQTGLLVPVGDLTALRSAVRRMIANPAGAGRMAERGRELCRTRFSAETMVAALEQVYARTLESARARPAPGISPGTAPGTSPGTSPGARP